LLILPNFPTMRADYSDAQSDSHVTTSLPLSHTTILDHVTHIYTYQAQQRPWRRISSLHLLTPFLVITFLSLLAIVIVSAQSDSGRRSAAALSVESLLFDSLTPDQLQTHDADSTNQPATRSSSSNSIVDRLSSLSSGLSMSTLVDVVLVGFDGLGREKDGDAAASASHPEQYVRVESGELSRYLQHAGLNKPHFLHALEGMKPEGDERSADVGGRHATNFSTRFLPRVVHAPQHFAQRLHDSLQREVEVLLERNPHLIWPARRKSRSNEEGVLSSPNLPTIPLPATIVDKIIAEEHQASARATAIYLLNLPPVELKEETEVTPGSPSSTQITSTRLRYVFTQHGGDDEAEPASSSCPTWYWMSSASSRNRYVWFDLGAGPVSYGPQSFGEGMVTEVSTPSVRRLWESQTKEARAKWRRDHEERAMPANEIPPFVPSPLLSLASKHTLLSDMAKLVSQVTNMLLNPPAEHWPIDEGKSQKSNVENVASRTRTTKIHFVFVHERHEGAATVATKAEMDAKQGATDTDTQTGSQSESGIHISSSTMSSDKPFDATSEEAAWKQYPDDDSTGAASPSLNGWDAWSAIEKTLLRLTLPGHRIELHNHHLRFEECSQCVSAYTHALRSHTSTVLAPDADAAAQSDPLRAASALRTTIHHYLDSKELKDWIEHFDENEWGLKADKVDSKGRGRDTTSDSVRVIRVFIYDLASTDLVLFDRFHQSVVFPDSDLIVGVQSRVSKALVDFSCDATSVSIDPRDASRSVLGSVLEVAFGVSPSFRLWDSAKNTTRDDFLFTLGYTPFAPFSTKKTLSFAIKDAALRHMVLSELHRGMHAIAQYLPSPHSHSSSSSQPSPSSRLLNELLDSHSYSTSFDLSARLNVLAGRLHSARRWLGLGEFDRSWMFAQAFRIDAQIIAKWMQQQVKQLEIKIRCGGEAMRKAENDDEGYETAISSTHSSITASNYLFFLLFEVLNLTLIVSACWWLASNPDRAAQILSRVLPRSAVRTLGLSKIVDQRHKD